MRKYYLAPHVRSCRTEDGVVLLDLRTAEYMGVGGEDLQKLELLVHEWAHFAPDETTPLTAQFQLAEELVAQGLLTTAAPLARDTEPAVQVPAPRDEVTCEEVLSGGELRGLQVAGIVLAYVRARGLLRLCSLQTIVAHVRKMKARHESGRAGGAQEVRALARKFCRGRPLVFTTYDECLLDSLVLLEFLAGSGLSASWVVGVKTRPFAAHSWVQHGDVVLNDTVQRVKSFIPILAI